MVTPEILRRLTVIEPVAVAVRAGEEESVT
jgi:hypothetical protein